VEIAHTATPPDRGLQRGEFTAHAAVDSPHAGAESLPTRHRGRPGRPSPSMQPSV